MKFEDLQVGMLVRDHVGNRYKVLALYEHDPNGYTVKLKCTVLNKFVGVGYNLVINFVGEEFWVQNSRTQLLTCTDPTVQQILKGLGYNLPDADGLYGCVRVPMLDEFGVAHDFWVYDKKTLDTFELTVDELMPLPQPLPVSSLRVGMKLTNATNNECVLIGFDDEYAHLAYMIPRIPGRGASISSVKLVRQQLVDDKLLGYTPVED